MKNLYVNLEAKMNWRPHIDKVIEKSISRMWQLHSTYPIWSRGFVNLRGIQLGVLEVGTHPK